MEKVTKAVMETALEQSKTGALTLSGQLSRENLVSASVMLAAMKSQFPNHEITEEGAELSLTLWARLLEEYGPEKVNPAMLRILETSRFFPSVAEVREVIEAMTPKAYHKPFKPLKVGYDCGVCSDSGWAPIPGPSLGKVQRCECRKGRQA